ncbi:Tetraspanin, EC2 domain and Tetraspanin/Peripherin family-containing protein [Strongyloides ratti]|uniref:Tetraspanin n=1 Tax=Strongyloides ratti TaxID=34506 RepID=A0A090N0X4_STRRB|nr:Tetraspanin, EC2 domain and Tetraspanin/Peripherin family-containing protein [Strongyloides ratti]CEF71443.1 Tetraspanin, EC2 domain and Tetraspanin/Peripherin family-containing protein [Strongyloides ratti]
MGSFGLRSAYGSFGRSTRMIFFTTNLFSILFLLITLFFGIWMVTTYSAYSELLAPSLYVDVARIMIVVSFFGLINSLFGYWCIIKEVRCLSYTYCVTSIVISTMLFIGGMMGHVFVYKLYNQVPLSLKMLTSLRELYGMPGEEDITNSWDELQKNFECCGVNEKDNWKVWKTSKWHMHYKTNTEKPGIPDSCCRPGMLQHCRGQFLLEEHLYEQTCHDLLNNSLGKVTRVAGYISNGASLIIIVPVIFAFLYTRLIRK